MRRRTAFRGYAFARLLLCFLVLAQSSMASAAPASWPNRTSPIAPAIFEGLSPAAARAGVSTNAGEDAPAAGCAPNACAVYLPWLVAGIPSMATPPAAPTATPTSIPSATPTPTNTPSETPTPAPSTTPAGDSAPPSAPLNLRATSTTSTTISLAWDAATDNVAVTEYVLYSGSTLVLTSTSLFATFSALSPGTRYIFTVLARNAAGNLSPASAPLAATTDVAAQPGSPDTQAPTTPDNLRATGKTHGTVALAWDASRDDVGVEEYDIYGDGVWIDSTSATTYTVTNLAAISSHLFTVAAYDASGNISDASDALAITTTLPPDPSTLAPTVDQTVASNIASDSAFIYSGDDPIQSGVAAGAIEAQHIAILRGRVLTRDGAPLAGVQISILGQDQYGRTVSRADGAFDLAVNGGQLTLNYQKEGFLPAQRQVAAPWRDYLMLPDVALVMLDQAVTTISLDEDGPLQAAAGSVVSDTDGVRQALLLFPAYTTATLELLGGAEQPLTTLHVRATEYTVGERGPAAMPGTLPLESGYTYAVDYSVDEALAAGARQVRFSQPVIGYVENFLHFAVGESVPAGSYDREQAAWVASDSGRIIKIVGVTDGRADLDLTGSGEVDDPIWLGISDAEREQLASRYTVGQELWRVEVPHFSPWDFNYPLIQ